ncbi:MAG: hypothetical protein QGH60_06695 [Phycisphaerae bacterium]|nr:hypothetical protein [Phycisphaerae bacterium]
MKCVRVLICVLAVGSAASAGEVLFTGGTHEHGGMKYYWLAEWKIEVTLPGDITAGDRLEVLFGSKGTARRTIHYTCDGQSGSLSDVRKKPLEWIALRLGKLTGGKKVVLYGKGSAQVGFLAGVRVIGKSTGPLKVKPIRVAVVAPPRKGRLGWADLSGFEISDRARSLWNPSPQKCDWKRAERSSKYAGIALGKVQRWLRQRVLPIRDAKTGLFRSTARAWNYRDTAADCYPFYVWAAFYTDKKVLDTVMIDTLKAEQKLCNHFDRLPVRYDLKTGRKVVGSLGATIFGACEYAKDGLVAIVEITGRDSPWFDRMRGIVDDIFKHAPYDSPYGKIPSKNIEVNGELLQILPRLYCMTGDRKYLNWAHRLADYYLLGGKFVPLRLSDHGCEIIGGLGLLLAIDAGADPKKLKQYKPHMEYMFDEILRRGINSDGVIIGSMQKTPGPHDRVKTGDGWGYDFVGFLDYDLAMGSKRYYDAIRRPLKNLLKPRYKNFNWDHNSRDNVADSVEGGLYLLRRFPTPEGFVWADREIATLLVDHTDPKRLWDTHKLEANTVRTVLIHTMLHTRNTIARPWRQGLQLGAAPAGDGICVYMRSDKAYEGKLQFDIPRHRIYMGFKQDWPRMNSVPEWFTVEPDEAHKYTVRDADTGKARVVSGKVLSAGFPVSLETNKPLRLIVRPRPRAVRP